MENEHSHLHENFKPFNQSEHHISRDPQKNSYFIKFTYEGHEHNASSQEYIQNILICE